MDTPLTLVTENLHEVQVDGRRMLFHIPTTSLFELDGLAARVIDRFRLRPTQTAVELARDLDCPSAEVEETMAEMVSLEILSDSGRARIRPQPRIDAFPLTTLVLNVNTGCNLSCSYCYKEDLDTPSAGKKMAFDTAARSIAMLYEESPDQPRYNLVFFGGEPLSNMPLIRQVTAFAQGFFAERGKQVDFTLTTNGTLLTEDLVDWFNQHRFGLTISMDGPQRIHDLRRKTVGGLGTYKVVADKARMLLSRYRARPVGARVTLTAGVTEVEAIWEHLFNELGFHEVGFSPVTAGDIDLFNLSGDDLEKVFSGMKRLGSRYVEAALKGENIGFSNMHQLMTDLHEGSAKSLPCGAGVAMLAVDKSGGLNLCHRFTGSDLPLFGTVEQGIDRQALSRFIEKRLDRSGTGCASCRIRNLCSGGCYHESYARYGDPSHPTYHYCDLMRDWVDFGIEAYGRIRAGNPGFFAQHIVPRKGNSQ